MRLMEGELGRLGMTEGVTALFRDALDQRDGLIIVAGPDGSGRATTVSAAFDKNPAATVTEDIGDRDSCETAFVAGSRGLVLARMEARHAVGAISRLRELRIDPITIAAGLRAVVAQRLVRRLCPHCREPVQADRSVSALLGFDPGTFIYAPRGCGACEGSGYRGRIGLFEVLRIEGAIRRLIGMDGDEAVIASHAFRDLPNLAGAARLKVRQGLIAAEDAVRLSRIPVRELV